MDSEVNGLPVLVTGGSGFIGRRLLAQLAARGAVVKALARSGHSARIVASLGATPIGPDVSLHQALDGAEVLFNLAYDVRAPGKENLTAFQDLIGAAVVAGVDRIVQASSIVVYDDWPHGNLTEHSPINADTGHDYRRTKVAMEQALLTNALPAAILQPTLVYGPGSRLWTDHFLKAFARGDVVLPDPSGNCNAVFVDDVVQAMLRAATVPSLGRERMIISGHAPVAWTDFLGGYADIVGRGGLRREPVASLRERLGPPPVEGEDTAGPSAAARISALARRVLGHDRFEALVNSARSRIARGGDTYPDHHMLSLMAATGACDISKARQTIGYEPEFDLAAGMNECRKQA